METGKLVESTLLFCNLDETILVNNAKLEINKWSIDVNEKKEDATFVVGILITMSQNNMTLMGIEDI